MSEKKIQSAKFKKDYMMLLAFLLFFLIVSAELFLSFWLPWHIKLDNMWAEQVARQELIDLYDMVRAESRSVADRGSLTVNTEALLICRSLDRAASSMHQHGKDLSPEQCRPFMTLIQKLHVHNNRLIRNKPYSGEVELNKRIFLRRMRGVKVVPPAAKK